MYELICRSLKKRASEAEEAQLRDWRAAAPENERQYQELARLGGLVDEVVFAPSSPAPPPAAAMVRRAAAGRRETTGPARWWTRPVWAWSGGVGILAAAVIAWLLLVPGGAVDRAVGSGEEFVTDAGETETVLLADGTVVRLAPESRLRLAGEDRPREVFLDGTAYFAVVRDPQAPFRVHTDAGEAVVLGTRFELRTRGTEVRLVVVEGRVALAAESAPVVVEAGEMSRISEGKTAAPVRVENVRSMLSWLEHFVVFQSTPLAEAAQELEKEYGVSIEVRDSALAAQTLTGRYSEREFGELFGIICEVLQARCTLEDGIATIDGGP
jgi:transmembrane sensor